MNFGIELEFFVLNQKEEVVPAYLVTNNLDGNPILGELRTKVHNNIVDCVFELQKLAFLEKEKIESKGYKVDFSTEKIVSDEFRRNLRKQKEFVDKKEMTVLEEFSIYPKGSLGKMLPKGLIKASLQINFSDNKDFPYTVYEKVTVEDKYKYDSKQERKNYSGVFNYVNLLFRLDQAFSKEITDTKRIKGVYAIKDGELGKRIEYRSLPNNICLEKLIKTLK